MKLSPLQYRLKYGLLWKTDKPPRAKWQVIILSIFVGFMMGSLITLGIIVFKLYLDNEFIRSKLLTQHELTMKYSAMVARVMNGQALWDANTQTAYFFDKPTAIVIK